MGTYAQVSSAYLFQISLQQMVKTAKGHFWDMRDHLLTTAQNVFARKLNKEDAMDCKRWRKHIRDDGMTMTGVSGWMFLLVSTRPGCPGQGPESRKMVVVVVVVFAHKNYQNCSIWNMSVISLLECTAAIKNYFLHNCTIFITVHNIIHSTSYGLVKQQFW